MSGGARVESTALDELGTALRVFATDATGATATAHRAGERVLGDIRAALAAREGVLRQAESRLAACEADEKRSCHREAAAVDAARRQVEAAKAARATATAALGRYAPARSRFDRVAGDIARDGSRGLTLLRTDIELYLKATGGGSAAGGGVMGPSSSLGAAPAGGGAGGGSGGGGAAITVPAGFPDGFAMVPLSLIDGGQDDPGGWGAGMGPSELRWGLDALHDVVMPNMAAGRGADYFAARDAEHERYGSRSLSDTYRGFFNDANCIQLDRQADGSYRIGNGRHRIFLARQMGLDAIPAKLG